ncbi:MAG: aminoacyl-tRNA hydrolase [Anaerolineae bacterium]|nr:aminoacyl-tRNA hydrolase [Anaerolineae bacterium]
MINITTTIILDEDEIHYDFIHASGPGGQHVNKAATAVQLRFDVAQSPSLPDDVRARLLEIAGQLITQEGVLVIDAHRYRSQPRNREDALQRLIALIRQAAAPPRPRHRTHPPRASKAQRRQDKRRRSEIKQLRRPPQEY